MNVFEFINLPLFFEQVHFNPSRYKTWSRNICMILIVYFTFDLKTFGAYNFLK